MEPGDHLDERGSEPAVVMAGSGEIVTYDELDQRSKRLAQLLHAAGLRPGDHMALILENQPRYLEIYWAALRAGLYLTPVNWHLKPHEAAHIIEDCGASAVIASVTVADTATRMGPVLERIGTRLVIGGELDGFDRYEEAVAAHDPDPLPVEVEGRCMFYSSGTTGTPKGVKVPLSGRTFGEGVPPLVEMIQRMYGFTGDTVYLCPGPLYHAAPLGWSAAVQRLGGTVVVMERFDAEATLSTIERHRVTHAQFVPTHFVRMLSLDPEVRARYDTSSLQVVVHAAAPCPVEVKERMISWWGEIVHEYYAGTESNGFCAIGPGEWLAHKGSVGRSLAGTVHIVGADGREAEVGVPGQVWFENDLRFEYHNDAAKTAAAFDEHGWSTLGDVGYMDDDGYLYLTDRVAHTIISGGVNIYPQEVENVLALHPRLLDAAVIGVPHPEMGESVVAVVVPAPGLAPGPELEAEIIEYCRARLAHYKCPVIVELVEELPRLPNGKLVKRELRDRFG